MDREIKFRAWHMGTNEIIYPNRQWHLFAWEEDEKQPIEIMQYTGLKDKNGKEIYEGDVVRITVNKHWWVFVIEPSKMAPNGQLYAIERFNNCSIDEDNNTYTYEVTRENSGRRKELLFGNDFEVIGNIYENPELLENTDE